MSRNDGEQELSSLDVTTPPGFTAKLAGVSTCSDAAIAAAAAKSGADEQASPSCPAASQVGTRHSRRRPRHRSLLHVRQGLPRRPLQRRAAQLRLHHPGGGGPFDLGDVVVRAAVFLNSETTQVTVKTDPLPQMLDGVPLRLRSLETKLDRADFTLNPTDCKAMSVSATISGSDGAAASPTQPFQASGCNALGFKPKLKLGPQRPGQPVAPTRA